MQDLSRDNECAMPSKRAGQLHNKGNLSEAAKQIKHNLHSLPFSHQISALRLTACRSSLAVADGGRLRMDWDGA